MLHQKAEGSTLTEREHLVFSFPGFQLTILKLDWQKTWEQTWFSFAELLKKVWGFCFSSQKEIVYFFASSFFFFKKKKSIHEENSPSVSHVSCSWLKSWKRSTDSRGDTRREVILDVLLDVNKMHMWWLWHLPGLPAILGGWRRAEVKKEERFQTTLCFYLQIPEGATLFPCISFWLPLTVCLRAHFHAISVRTHTKQGKSEVRRLRALVWIHGAKHVFESWRWKQRAAFRVLGKWPVGTREYFCLSEKWKSPGMNARGSFFCLARQSAFQRFSKFTYK